MSQPVNDRGEPEGPPTAEVSAQRLRLLQKRSKLFLRSRMVWNRAYRVLSYVKSALWVVPLVAIVMVLIVGPLLRSFDTWTRWRFVGLDVDGARALYQTLITLNLSFLVFTFGSLLVAIQVAGGQLSPRIIATTLLRDNVVRYSVGLFVFSLLFAVLALNRLQAEVLELVAFLNGLLGVVSLVVFLFLIDYAARLLRPVSVSARVGEEGLKVIATFYPTLAEGAPLESEAAAVDVGPTQRKVPHAGKSETVTAVDLDAILLEAMRSDGVVEVIPQVGDFVAQEELLFALHGGAAAIDDRKLVAAVAFGSERTMEQDPLFAFRILVDIAIKALSPAINDPTTAVEAIAQIQRLLRSAGRRRLRGEVIVDSFGHPRVIFRTPNWDDFVLLACHEIRYYGANNLQIARRLRGMLEDLVRSLPPNRHRCLLRERDLLDQMIEKVYILPADRELARIPDSQGLGGSSRRKWTGT